MRRRPRLGMALLLSLLGCAGPPPTAEQRHATDLNPSGRPYAGPPGVRSSFPPADPDISAPLLCHPEGEGTVCARAPSS